MNTKTAKTVPKLPKLGTCLENYPLLAFILVYLIGRKCVYLPKLLVQKFIIINFGLYCIGCFIMHALRPNSPASLKDP